MDEFYPIRYQMYVDRKAYLLNELQRMIHILEMKKRFIEDVINLVYQVLQLYLYKRHLVKRIEKNNFGRREEW